MYMSIYTHTNTHICIYLPANLNHGGVRSTEDKIGKPGSMRSEHTARRSKHAHLLQHTAFALHTRIQKSALLPYDIENLALN